MARGKKVLGTRDYSRDPDAINWPWQAGGDRQGQRAMEERFRDRDEDTQRAQQVERDRGTAAETVTEAKGRREGRRWKEAQKKKEEERQTGTRSGDSQQRQVMQMQRNR